MNFNEKPCRSDKAFLFSFKVFSLQSDIGEESFQFVTRKFPVLAGGEGSETDIHDPDTLECGDSSADSREHATDLVFASFGEDDGEGRVRDALHATRLRRPVLEHGPLFETVDHVGADTLPYRDDVFLFVVIFRREESLRHPPVIGEDDESRGHLVESADREDPGNTGDIGYRLRRMPLFRIRQNATRFMIGEIVILPLIHVGDGHIVALVHAIRKNSRAAVYAHFPGPDKVIGPATRGDTRERQVAVYPNGVGDVGIILYHNKMSFRA